MRKETHVPVGMGAWLQEGWPWGKQPGLLSVGAVLGSASVPLRAPSLGDLVDDLTEHEGRGLSRVCICLEEPTSFYLTKRPASIKLPSPTPYGQCGEGEVSPGLAVNTKALDYFLHSFN